MGYNLAMTGFGAHCLASLSSLSRSGRWVPIFIVDLGLLAIGAVYFVAVVVAGAAGFVAWTAIGLINSVDKQRQGWLQNGGKS